MLIVVKEKVEFHIGSSLTNITSMNFVKRGIGSDVATSPLRKLFRQKKTNA
jgi:hypothetical protein